MQPHPSSGTNPLRMLESVPALANPSSGAEVVRPDFGRRPTHDAAVEALYLGVGDPSRWPALLRLLGEFWGFRLVGIDWIDPLGGSVRFAIRDSDSAATTAESSTRLQIDGDETNRIVLWVSREERTHPLGVPESALRMRGHLCGAAALARRQKESSERAQDASVIIDHYQKPLWLLELGGRLFSENTAARQFRVQRQIIRIADDRLECVLASEQRRLQIAIAATSLGVGEPVPRVLRIGENAHSFVTAIVSRLTPAAGSCGRSFVTVLLHDPRTMLVPDPAVVSEAFGFSPAESKVAIQLAMGQTAQQISIEHHVSLATVRSQIKSLLNKSGTNRQVDLIRLLTALPARHGFSA